MHQSAEENNRDDIYMRVVLIVAIRACEVEYSTILSTDL